ncbi:MAG: hypothetical protein OEO77_08420 [Acidimicrobiia bacterium]|nr:hypothetical protein [Acidimicrobiia bacterium]
MLKMEQERNGIVSNLIWVYLIYGAAAVGLTVWLARTLFRNGAVFLEDVFGDKPAMAEAVNRLLVVGFYMLNLGYAFLIFRANTRPADAVAGVELLVDKLGILLVSLGVIHFINLLIFWRIRGRSKTVEPQPPVLPRGMLQQPGSDKPWA